MSLRLVEEEPVGVLPHDEAIATLNEHWKAARSEYVEAIGAIGDDYLRQLVSPPKRGLSRSHMALVRDQARLLAQHATRMADELDRAVEIYHRVER